MRILGIDYGDSRIGVAVSDEGSRLAFGVCVVDASKGRKHAVTELLKLKEKYGAELAVIGLPSHLNGTKGDRRRILQLCLKTNVLRQNMRTG